jgi:hypothetical protein
LEASCIRIQYIVKQEDIMELQAARQIIDTLSQGIHPVTGEVMPEDSPYNAPPVIRALFAVSHALDETAPAAARSPRTPPANAGKPWLQEEDDQLEAAFAAGAELKQIAQQLGRTLFAIEARLAKLGKLPPKPGMRVGAAPASSAEVRPSRAAGTP